MLNQGYQYYYKILFKGVFALFLLFSLFLLPMLSATAETATTESGAHKAAVDILNLTSFQANFKTNGSPTTFQIIGSVINMVLGFVGIIFFGFIFYAGFTWFNAQGNAEAVDKAIHILKESFIGLIIVSLAFILTNYVIFKLIGYFIE